MGMVRDKLFFDLSFGQDGSELESDSILIGGAEHNLDGAEKRLFRQDQSTRMMISGPLSVGEDAELAAATIAASPTGADRTSLVVTITTSAAHGASVGDEIEVSGVTDSSFDGRYTIESVPTSTTFTYTQASGADTTSGTGSVTNYTRNPRPLMLGALSASNLVENLTSSSGSLNVNITGGAAGSNTEYAEDSAHGSGDVGNFVLAVRNDVEGSMVSADGDYSPLQVDSVGRLRVIADLDVTNLAEKAEDSAHGSGDVGNYILSVREDVPVGSTTADGDYQSLKTDSIGNLWVKHNGDINIADGGNSITVDNAALSVVGGGVEATALRVTIANDSTGLLSIDDNGGSITVDGTFWQATQPVSNAGVFSVQEDGAALTALQLIDNLVLLEDVAAAGGESGVQALAVRQDTLANSVSATGDFASLKLNSVGGLWTVPVGDIADDGVDSGNPVKIGARAVSAVPAAVAAADRVDLITDLRRRLMVHDAPNISSSGAVVSVDTTAGGIALPAAALAGRTRMIIQNASTQAIFVGPSGSVTTANGIRVSARSTLSLEIGDQIALAAIVGAGTSNVRVFEMA